MSRHSVFFAVAMVLLVATAVGLVLPGQPQEVPLRAPLALIVTSLAGWTGEPGVEPALIAVGPNAPERLLATYRGGEQTIGVAVDYYPAQHTGLRPPTRDLLFPRAGWTEITEQPVQIPVGGPGAEPISARLVLMRGPDREVATTYWYQVGHRTTSSDYSYRLLVLFNRFFHLRTDGALVRVASVVPAGVPAEAAVARQSGFIRAFYPELLRSIAP